YPGADFDNGKVTSRTINYGEGYGGGLNMGLGLGEVMGVELRGTYVSGKEQETTSTNDDGDYSSNRTSTAKTTYLRVEPALRATVGKSQVKVYIAAGPSIALGTKLTIEGTDLDRYEDPFNPDLSYTRTSTDQGEYEGGVGWGGFGALGLVWAPNTMFGVFAEAQATAQTWAPTQGKGESRSVTNYDDGTTQTYNDSFDVDYVESYEADDETKGLRTSLVLSTWGFRAGLRFSFGGDKPAAEAPKE
ncbi:MAG: hypothetical protein ABI599_09805, partial [Flavobacteriales bacterium]